MVEIFAGLMLVIALALVSTGILWMLVESKAEYKLVCKFQEENPTWIAMHKA